MMKRVMATVFFVLCSVPAWSDIVGISGQKITDIRVNPWNTDSFAIRTTTPPPPPAGQPSTVVCEGSWVIFKKENAASDAAYDRAYSLAVSAISMDQPVYVVIASDCTSAKTIAIIQ